MTESLEQPVPKTFSDQMRAAFRLPLNFVAGYLSRLGVTANMVTLFGLVGVAVGSIFLANGQFGWASVVLLIMVPFDALDGALARLNGVGTPFGAMLDSFTDRYAELFLYGSLMWFFMGKGQSLFALLCLVAVGGSIMVSYARARAESLGAVIKEGWFSRVERLLVLGFAILFARPIIGVIIVAIGANLTAVQRLWLAYKKLS
jgi:CDP-diacylglycerol--glycerol-3-phosphate 3-phosphatidyltransferase